MPLQWISFAFIAGLVLGENLAWKGAGWLALAGACLLGWPMLRRLPTRQPWLVRLRWPGENEIRLGLPPMLLLAVLFRGAARMAFSGPNLAGGHVAAYNNLARPACSAWFAPTRPARPGNPAAAPGRNHGPVG